MTLRLKSPYIWMGGKRRVCDDVWERFGKVPNYVEPFFGSGAMLLGRPGGAQGIETANDLNAYLSNFWRAVQNDPDAVASAAADPVSELDLHARGDALFYKGFRLGGKTGRLILPDEFCERVREDVEFYDARAAGWWVWGQSSWIGDNWGRVECRALPHLGDAGMGVNRQLPHLGDAGMGVTDTTRKAAIVAYMRQLAERFSRVRVCCGDWRRVLGPSPTVKLGITAVFLDPPYAVEDRADVYGSEDSATVAHDVRAWCLENGNNPALRIALCGYDEHDAEMPDTWERFAWKAAGGYASQGDGSNQNGARESIHFSPACNRQRSLFDQEP